MTTKQRILDSAERLFAKHGFKATSLRTIVADAKVNLAAIHYHYGTKEALIDAVLTRRLEPINRERLKLLAECGQKGTLEAVLEAFIAPAFRLEERSFVRLMGRIITEDEDHLARLIKQHFGALLERFTAALHEAAPDLPKEELFWRLHFTIGAMAHSLRLCEACDADAVTRKLVSFAAAGFRAPIPPGVHDV